MNYNDTIVEIIKERPNFFSNNVLLKNVISDYIKSDYDSIKQLNNLLLINEKTNIFELISNNQYMSKELLVTVTYNNFKNIIKKNEYVKVITPFINYLKFNEKQRNENEVTKNKTILQKIIDIFKPSVINNIYLNMNVKSLDIKISEENEFKLIIDGKEEVIDTAKYIERGTLKFNYVATKSDVRLTIPKIMCKNIYIKGYFTNVRFKSKYSNVIRNVTICNMLGSINLIGDFSKVKIKSIQSEINFKGIINKLSIKNDIGNIKYNIFVEKQKDINVNVKSQSGDICGYINNKNILLNKTLDKNKKTYHNRYNIKSTNVFVLMNTKLGKLVN